MKFTLVTSPLFFLCFIAYGDPITTKEQFLTAVQAAYQAKDVNRIAALTWSKGASDFDQQGSAQLQTMMIKRIKEIRAASLEPLPATFESETIAMGRRFDPTYPPCGIVTLVCTATNGHAQHLTTAFPYAVINGAYFLVGTKSTDLDWRGPKDQVLSYSITGNGANKVNIDIKYNVSGVNLEKKTSVTSMGFIGQYIDELTVTSTNQDTNISLVLASGPMNSPIFNLTGNGTIHYKRAAPSPAATQ